MNQASCSWADISLGCSSFDVISSMHSVDKLGCPFLTVEALIYAKKKQRNPLWLTTHVALVVCIVFGCVPYIYRSIIYCLVFALKVVSCIFYPPPTQE